MNLIGRLKSSLFNYTYVTPIGSSYNTNILLKRNLACGLWVGKISRSLIYSSPNYSRIVDFKDFDARGLLAYRLAKLVGIKTLKAKVVPSTLINDFNIESAPNRINNDIFLTKYGGQPLPEYLKAHNFSTLKESDIKNKDAVIANFVFNLWIGNYDKKDADYVVDEHKNMVSIDYQLSGPGFQDDIKLSLGGWGESFDFNNPGDTAWCLDGNKALVWQYFMDKGPNLEMFLPTVNKITLIKKGVLLRAFNGLNFYTQGTDRNITNDYLKFLLERRLRLKDVLQAWINSGFTYDRRPKNNGIQ